MQDFEIKRADIADLNRIAPLVAAFHVEEGVGSDEAGRRESLARLLSEPQIGGIWIAARGDADPVAYVALAFGFAIEFEGRDAFVDEVYVTPDSRGAGLGARLLKAAQEAAIGLGLKALHLEVHQDNEKAARLYDRLGFARRPYRLMSMRLGENP